MSDASLRQDILDELEFEPSIDANDIGVAVEAGIVTLSGHVPTFAQKLAVEHAVGRIRGVRGIAQEIEVRTEDGKGNADDEIARRAVDMLKWSTLVPDDKVRITVQRGWVTLSGELDWHYQKRGAFDVVRDIKGVTGVTDLIELKPRIATADVQRQIEGALERSARLEGRAIQVSVLGNKIILDGTVRTWSDRNIAEQAAWSVPGVTDVEDRLSVG